MKIPARFHSNRTYRTIIIEWYVDNIAVTVLLPEIVMPHVLQQLHWQKRKTIFIISQK